MCAQSAVLARTIQEYSKRKFEGDVVPGKVTVSREGELHLRNDRYVTRIRGGDSVLIQTATGDILKGRAQRAHGKTVCIRLQDQSAAAISASPVDPDGVDFLSSAAYDDPSSRRSNTSGRGERRKRSSKEKTCEIEVVSVDVEVGQLASNADMARDCFAKDLLTGAKTSLTPMIEMFFGDAPVFKAAKEKLKNCGLYRLPMPPSCSATAAADAAAASLRKRQIKQELLACAQCGRLNQSQYGAANAITVSNAPVVLIQGPPGSGKSIWLNFDPNGALLVKLLNDARFIITTITWCRYDIEQAR
ncbi:MAG: hypothetical protein BJ554DRAFT_493 [Olpidium bornovanus]|uniref:Uncharacterized protein n=1 Tax=Olpidium bornovanus TaxID=278681 RepID=A0A8H8DI49_9FUNG|nr:MAG: hypothetical protein BJ554DRAFT_493 [Olpidium bornovanus]